ncbi:hypothetical protein LDO31_15110 [Luteimonas sp. XNQY3]|nr:hypothetical protein [Luteimonas sp. XNQY3]MCD9007543.1 hypothetical protein [Luteimonas sp. XNQY3]
MLADLPRSPYLELVLRYERWGLPPLRAGLRPYLPHLPDPQQDPVPE